MKTCTGCKNELLAIDFFKDKAKKDGLTSRCKSCHALARGREYGIGRRVYTALGTVFGRLVTIGQDRWTEKTGSVALMCRCLCGSEKEFDRGALKSGATKSCGCLRADVLSVIKSTHRGSKSWLYSRWYGMKQRCENPKHKNYDRYGGRGISVCAAWTKDFTVFRAWAMSSGFHEALEIDRTNNDLGYSPENCRWVSHKVNSNNRNPFTRRKKDVPHQESHS